MASSSRLRNSKPAQTQIQPEISDKASDEEKGYESSKAPSTNQGHDTFDIYDLVKETMNYMSLDQGDQCQLNSHRVSSGTNMVFPSHLHWRQLAAPTTLEGAYERQS